MTNDLAQLLREAAGEIRVFHGAKSQFAARLESAAASLEAQGGTGRKETAMNNRILTCVYCGHEYPQDTPAHSDKVLTDHISVCEKHPMRAVVEQRNRLRDALAGMIGASTKEELDAMEVGVRLLPGCDEDRAVALNAIHALRACAA